MWEDFRSHKIIDGRTAIRTFLAGAISTAVFIIAYFSDSEPIALIMGIFLAWAILMVFDAVFPHNRKFHGLTGIVFLVLGVISSIILSPFPFIYLYMVVLLVISFAVYFKPIRKRLEVSDDLE